MSIFALALLIGVVAGLRSMTAPAAVAWAARGWPLTGTPMAFFGVPAVAWAFTALALAELIVDKLPKTPSRRQPAPLIARVVSGAVCGAAIGATANALVSGAVIGAIGAVLGTFAGFALRSKLAKALRRDLPAALIEDAVAVVGAALVVWAVA